jgi:hypothetical protein
VFWQILICKEAALIFRCLLWFLCFWRFVLYTSIANRKNLGRTSNGNSFSLKIQNLTIFCVSWNVQDKRRIHLHFCHTVILDFKRDHTARLQYNLLEFSFNVATRFKMLTPPNIAFIVFQSFNGPISKVTLLKNFHFFGNRLGLNKPTSNLNKPSSTKWAHLNRFTVS